MHSRRKSIIKSSVRESVGRLLDQARKAYPQEDRSRRYVAMAFDLMKKHKVALPKDLRNSFCRKCRRIWIPGQTVTVTYDAKNNCLRVRCICGHSKRL